MLLLLTSLEMFEIIFLNVGTLSSWLCLICLKKWGWAWYSRTVLGPAGSTDGGVSRWVLQIPLEGDFKTMVIWLVFKISLKSYKRDEQMSPHFMYKGNMSLNMFVCTGSILLSQRQYLCYRRTLSPQLFKRGSVGQSRRVLWEYGCANKIRCIFSFFFLEFWATTTT